MKKPVGIIGVGEMGGVFARGLLKLGHPVYPVARGQNPAQAAKDAPDLLSVIVAVGEKDLHPVLDTIPDQWRDRLVLLQNELLPKDWLSHQLNSPTVISVWFEKKQPNDFKVIIPSPVYGPQAQLIAGALGILKIPVKILKSEHELLFELILKNLYIVTTNVCGLKVSGTVGELWQQHRDFARQVANEVLDIQFQMAGQKFDRDQLIAGMVQAFEGDPQHKCMGRSAPARLERALALAKEYKQDVPALEEINTIKT